MTEMRKLCTFYLGDYFLGVDAAQVQEILRPQQVTSVPLAPPYVRGLMNLRGQIILAFDLRKRLASLPDREQPDSMNIVVLTRSAPISLLVQKVGEVLDVSEDDFEPPPATVQGISRTFIHGVYKLKSKLLISLDLENILYGPGISMSQQDLALGHGPRPASA